MQRFRRRKGHGLFWKIVAVLLIFVGSGLYFLLNDNLRAAHLASHLPYQAEWATPPPPHTIQVILSQPFTYLSEGGQSIAFLSADQRYVLKLFKFKNLRPSYSVQLLPNLPPFRDYKARHLAKRQRQLQAAFNGHKVAYDLHRPESGLVFMQLNASHSDQWVTVEDKWGFTRALNLREAAYVLQEKGEILSVVLAQLLDQGQIQTVKERIGQLFDLYLSEYHKGIYDLDRGVMHNIGCIEERLFHLDVGNFVRDEQIKQPDIYQKDLIKIASKVRTWVIKNYPQYAEEISQDIERRLSHLFSKEFRFPL